MKIVIDKDIPFIRGVFEPYAGVEYCGSSEICNDILRDADALVIRSRTLCDASKLEGSKLKIISITGTGTDHIDVSYCREHGIFVQNSAGSNAVGVMNYVCSAIYGVAARKSMSLSDAVLGIVGLGDSGKRVEQMALYLGLKVLRCDPALAEQEGRAQYCDLDYLLRHSDIVSLHIPLNGSTMGLANAEFFSKMKLGSMFINTSRGGIVNEADLLSAVPKLGSLVIDTWNGEPDINKALMDAADIATPHIAGYTYKSKLLSTSMAVKAVARFLGINGLFDFYPAVGVESLESVKLSTRGMSQGEIASMIQYNYPVFTDDFLFRMNPDKFEELRANYRYRREFYFY